MSLSEHSLRRQVVGEMHLRRWPPVAAPAVIIQILRIVPDELRAAERAALAQLPAGGQAHATDNPKHLSGQIAPGIAFAWEQHSEASGVTLFAAEPDAAMLADPLGHPGLSAALDWATALPGEVLRATRITVVPDSTTAEAMLPVFGFAATDLVSCHVGAPPAQGEAVRIWSDFRLRDDGFGALLVAANGAAGGDVSRLIQRMQELGNYRNLALLGLPVAQAGWSQLSKIEQALSELARDVTRLGVSDETLLERVSVLSLELMSIATAASFRMSATAAYAQLVEERLAELAPRAIPGFPSLSDFTQRRLLPAVRTCAAHVRREGELSRRTGEFTALLRTRIETRIELQNARQLENMERSARLQLRMQQLVEGFSVLALSYYAVGLASYVMKGLEHALPHFDAVEATSVATPVILLGMWATLRWLKRRVLGEH